MFIEKKCQQNSLIRNHPKIEAYTVSLTRIQGKWCQCKLGPYDPSTTQLEDLLRDSQSACASYTCTHVQYNLIEEEKLLNVKWTPSVTPSGRYYLIENLCQTSPHRVDHMVHEEDTLKSILQLSGLNPPPSCLDQLSLLSQ